MRSVWIFHPSSPHSSPENASSAVAAGDRCLVRAGAAGRRSRDRSVGGGNLGRAVSACLGMLMLLLPGWLYAGTFRIDIGPMNVPIMVQGQVDGLQALRQKHVVLQHKDYSCGAASMATLFNYYLEYPISEGQVIRELIAIAKKSGTLIDIIRRRGFSLLDLKRFAESKGFKAVGYRLEFKDLVDLHMPALVPIIPSGFKHFVVFRGADERFVYLADPSFGNLTENIDAFKRDWYGFTNVALVVLRHGEKQKEGHPPPLSLTAIDKIHVNEEGFNYYVNSLLNNPPWGPFYRTEF